VAFTRMTPEKAVENMLANADLPPALFVMVHFGWNCADWFEYQMMIENDATAKQALATFEDIVGKVKAERRALATTGLDPALVTVLQRWEVYYDSLKKGQILMDSCATAAKRHYAEQAEMFKQVRTSLDTPFKEYLLVRKAKLRSFALPEVERKLKEMEVSGADVKPELARFEEVWKKAKHGRMLEEGAKLIGILDVPEAKLVPPRSFSTGLDNQDYMEIITSRAWPRSLVTSMVPGIAVENMMASSMGPMAIRRLQESRKNAGQKGMKELDRISRATIHLQDLKSMDPDPSRKPAGRRVHIDVPKRRKSGGDDDATPD